MRYHQKSARVGHQADTLCDVLQKPAMCRAEPFGFASG